MSYIPNCREDKTYNEKYLNEKDKEFVRGFDFAVNDSLDSFFANIDDMDFDVEDEDIDLGKILNNHEAILDRLKENMLEWIEGERDEMITSMIDHMDENEFEENKAKYANED